MQLRLQLQKLKQENRNFAQLQEAHLPSPFLHLQFFTSLVKLSNKFVDSTSTVSSGVWVNQAQDNDVSNKHFNVC